MSSNPLIAPELHTRAQEFLWFANEVSNASPLYEKLSRRIADDPEMLALAAHAPPYQPPANLLFAAVHYLLLRASGNALTMFYADLARRPNTTDDPYPIFRAFCLEHADVIRELLLTRRVQTNEVGRCALFLPAFELSAARVEHAPFAMIEVGCSAGLNLNWDRYAYDYGDGTLYGDGSAAVVLRCELRGDARPGLPELLPRVAARVGVDLNPNEVNDDDAMLWLRALVWPEQLDRAKRLARAIEIARQFPPRILQGDALELVPELLSEIPRATPTVLFHSFVLNQIPADARSRYYDVLAEHSTERMLFDIAIEPKEWPAPLVLTTFRERTRTEETLATCDFHGRWLQWARGDAV